MSIRSASNSSSENRAFMDDNFLLESDFARKLYFDYSKDLPIIDYHCHLPPDEIAADKKFEDLTSIWLNGDHYKWRAMRTLGVDEKYITGDAANSEKFEKWAQTVPYTMRNPLYHWTHLELQRYFGEQQILNPDSAKAIYESASAKLNTQEYSTRNILTKMNVEVVCSTDDPADTLEHHQKIRNDKYGVKILPTFRPDKAYAVEDPEAFKTYMDKLGAAAKVEIKTFDDLLAALENRVAFFHENGCRLSDHGLNRIFYSDKDLNVNAIFTKVLNGTALNAEETEHFKFKTLVNLGKFYNAKGWTQQFHLGALRNNNARALRLNGPDTGYDSIGDFSQAENLSRFLNLLASTDELTKTILYNLNPADNEVFATMIGNFQDGSIKGKVQFGSGWWFLDQKDGMEKQMNALSNMGLLSCFVGMLTDSRSFLSYPRHEYFRRILCNLIGRDVANGELPADEKWLGKLVSDISYYNAKEYFGFDKVVF